MLIRNKLAILMTIFIVVGSALSFSRESIALADLTAQGVPASSASIISDRLRNDLFSTGLFTVIERSQMDQILKEQGFQQSGCTSDACAVEVGQLLGVQYIAIGSVGYIGKTYTLNVRMIDVKTGEIIRSASEDCRCEIDELMKKMVPKIAKSMSSVVQASAPSSAKATTPAATATPKSSPNLNPNAAVLDPAPVKPTLSEKKEPASKAVKNRFIPRVAAGLVTAVGIGAGFYLNSIAQNEVTLSNSANQKYSNREGDQYLIEANDHKNKAKSASSLRNIAYGVGGLGMVGFALTFVF